MIFFLRARELESLCEALAGFDPGPEVDVAVVLVGEGGRCSQAIPVVPDPEAELAGRYGLPAPGDGGPPVGYAVVDGTGDIRYRTLDPEGLRLCLWCLLAVVVEVAVCPRRPSGRVFHVGERQDRALGTPRR